MVKISLGLAWTTFKFYDFFLDFEHFTLNDHTSNNPISKKLKIITIFIKQYNKRFTFIKNCQVWYRLLNC